MPLTELTLDNVRNFSQAAFAFTPQTALIGSNGSGKSSVIEAIRILSVGKSFRTSKFDEVISFEKPFFRLKGVVQTSNGQPQTIEFFYGQPFAEQPSKERTLLVNGKSVDWLSHLGSFPSVLFVPSDLEIVTGSPQTRRKYLDSILWQVESEFRQNYLDFTKVLRERSALLFLIKINRAGTAELQPWNELLVKLSEAIRQKRLTYVDYLQKELGKKAIGPLHFSVSYQANAVELVSIQKQEIQLAQNLYGCHRDELDISINDRLARRYASRGQARSAALLLKIIESQFLELQIGQPPLILLDDMFSELDQSNIQLLFDSFSSQNQLIVTSLGNRPLLKGYKQIKLKNNGTPE